MLLETGPRDRLEKSSARDSVCEHTLFDILVECSKLEYFVRHSISKLSKYGLENRGCKKRIDILTYKSLSKPTLSSGHEYILDLYCKN